MNTFKHIALIAAVSFFASCAKNEVVEPLNPAGSTSQVDDHHAAPVGSNVTTQVNDQPGTANSASLPTGNVSTTSGYDLDHGTVPGVKVVGITDAAVQ